MEKIRIEPVVATVINSVLPTYNSQFVFLTDVVHVQSEILNKEIRYGFVYLSQGSARNMIAVGLISQCLQCRIAVHRVNIHHAHTHRAGTPFQGSIIA